MNKRIVAICLCCMLIGISGCTTKPTVEKQKYKRISFESETLGEEMEMISKDASVVYNAKETIDSRMQVYEISKHAISEHEFQNMEQQLGITDWYINDFNGYEVNCRVAPFSDPDRSDFATLNMTDAELEELARETYNKIPFLEGEYEYAGQTGYMSDWSMETGEIITEVTVSFYKSIDGVCVVGNEQCDLTFDGDGLVGVYIAMYDYKAIGTMDMVPLIEAQEKLKTPDYFSVEQSVKGAKELQVDRVQLYLVNQYSRGCTILQPIYTFYGSVKMENGNQTEFKSRIIAIPESMTYEEE